MALRLPWNMTELIVRMERVEHGRDFRTEVRALLDVKHLIEDAVVKRNVEQTHVHTILLALFAELAQHNAGENFDITLFKASIFSVTEKNDASPRLHQKLQGYSGKDFFEVNQSWIATFCTLDGLKQRHIAIATLEEPTNLGLEMEETRIVALILAPSLEKRTKSAAETARTFGTLLSSDALRQQILTSCDEYQVRDALMDAATKLSEPEPRQSQTGSTGTRKTNFVPGRAIFNDARKVWKRYKSDYSDGVKDATSISKVISTAAFLLFTILPTSIAYGMLNDENTNGQMNVQKVILGQCIGGLFFGIFGGQQMLILSTTAPLSIYISVIYEVAKVNRWDFYALYAATGIYSQIILGLFAAFQFAHVIKFTTRSSEEIFSLFISFALTFKAVYAIVNTYKISYSSCYEKQMTPLMQDGCSPSSALLFIFLACGTLWLSLTINSFRSSPYLSRNKRDIFADYALPIAVVIMAAVSTFMFHNVDKQTFNVYPRSGDMFWIRFYQLPWAAHIPAAALAFPLAILFFMDQLLVTKTIDNEQNKLQKGSTHHWDLLVVAVLNIFLSIFGLPWMHGALPSAFLHLKALSDVEDRLHNGYIQTVIVKVRETRLSTLAAHVLMIPIYLWLVPYITVFMPTAIFNGLFLFMAVSSLTGNEFWERILLIFTEQRAYPPTHYIRQVPQRVVHLFTAVELVQLAVLICIGFAPYHYVEMVFPLIIALFIPFRRYILPLMIRKEFLEAIDGKH